MQIVSLRIFCDLVETESFTKTAQINNVTQSAVSQQMSMMEREFKSLLVERSKKQFRLTREGHVPTVKSNGYKTDGLKRDLLPLGFLQGIR